MPPPPSAPNLWTHLAAAEPSSRRACWWFLRALGIVNALAFVGVAVQIDGLAGERGILPAAELLDRAHAQWGARAVLQLPTLAWLDASGAGLGRLAWAGVAISGLLVANIAPALSLALLWILYRSLAIAGGEFFYFQWDALLVEADFLGMFAAPLHLWPRRSSSDAGPPRLAWWALRVLLFRVMFLSGVVKLASGDPAWRDLSALAYHFESQPLPAPLAWYAHHAPPSLLQLACAAMLAIELGVSWLLFTRARRWALAPLAGLQLAIMATGHYGFFNLLAIALCATAWDDTRPSEAVDPRRATWPTWLLVPVLGVALAAALPGSPMRLVVAPLGIGSPYGLFAVMTRGRPQLSFEGSRDGVTWHAYAFRRQPDDPDTAPALFVPVLARLDWQTWLAALGPVERTHWLERVGARLVEGSSPVARLFAGDPFPDGPPSRVRVVRWRYRFTRPDEPGWWVREREGVHELGRPRDGRR